MSGNEFQVGQRVRRVKAMWEGGHNGMQVGDEDTIVEVNSWGSVDLERFGYGHSPRCLMVVTEDPA